MLVLEHHLVIIFINEWSLGGHKIRASKEIFFSS